MSFSVKLFVILISPVLIKFFILYTYYLLYNIEAVRPLPESTIFYLFLIENYNLIIKINLFKIKNHY